MFRLFVPLAIAVSVATLAPAAAQEAELQPKITVSGEGEARIAPDMALITLSVLRQAETAREAMDANNAAMNEVIEALKAEGIESRDLQTSGLSIDPQYVYPNDRNDIEEPRITGYRVTNTLTISIRDIGKVGEVLDRSISLGVNQGGNIVFTNEDPSAALSDARKRAVEEAMAKARTLAEAAGVSLGQVLEISEQSAPEPPRPMMRAARMEMAASDAAVPVEAGQNTYRVQVNITFGLEQK